MIDACNAQNFGRPGDATRNAYLLVFCARRSLMIHYRIFDRLSIADVSTKYSLTSQSNRFLRDEDKEKPDSKKMDLA